METKEMSAVLKERSPNLTEEVSFRIPNDSRTAIHASEVPDKVVRSIEERIKYLKLKLNK